MSAWVVACAVVFVTTYALILPAITMDVETADEQPGVELNAAPEEVAVEEGAYEEYPAEEQAYVTEGEPGWEPVAEAAGEGETEAYVEAEPEPAAVVEPSYEVDSQPDLYDESQPAPVAEAEPAYEAESPAEPEYSAETAANDEPSVEAPVEPAPIFEDETTLDPQPYADEAAPVFDDSQPAAAEYGGFDDVAFAAEEAVVGGESVVEGEAQTQAQPAFMSGELKCKGEGFELTVTYDERAQIPEGAYLRVEELLDLGEYSNRVNGQTYADYYARTEALFRDEANTLVPLGARFFDIVVEKDGVRIEPAADVLVSIKYDPLKALAPDESLCVVHFVDDEADRVALPDVNKFAQFLPIEIRNYGDRADLVGEVRLNARTNSVYGVMPYAWFAYGLGGVSFAVSAEQGQAFALADAFEAANLVAAGWGQRFVEVGVRDVVSSDPAIVSVDANGWVVSVAPEAAGAEVALTVDMRNGEQCLLTVSITAPAAAAEAEAGVESEVAEPVAEDIEPDAVETDADVEATDPETDSEATEFEPDPEADDPEAENADSDDATATLEQDLDGRAFDVTIENGETVSLAELLADNDVAEEADIAQLIALAVEDVVPDDPEHMTVSRVADDEDVAQDWTIAVDLPVSDALPADGAEETAAEAEANAPETDLGDAVVSDAAADPEAASAEPAETLTDAEPAETEAVQEAAPAEEIEPIEDVSSADASEPVAGAEPAPAQDDPSESAEPAQADPVEPTDVEPAAEPAGVDPTEPADTIAAEPSEPGTPAAEEPDATDAAPIASEDAEPAAAEPVIEYVTETVLRHVGDVVATVQLRDGVSFDVNLSVEAWVEVETPVVVETPADEPADTTEADAPEPVYEPGTLSFTGDDFAVALSYGADARIPAGATLEVDELTEQSDPQGYADYLARAEEAVASDPATLVADARFFDIRIIVDGAEIEPAAPVDVRITSARPEPAPAEADVQVVHFSDGDAARTMPAPEPAEQAAGLAPEAVGLEPAPDAALEPAPDDAATADAATESAPGSAETVSVAETVSAPEPAPAETVSAPEPSLVSAPDPAEPPVPGEPAVLSGLSPAPCGEVLAAELLSSDTPTGTVDAVSFSAAGFSVYGVVYTVDFHWEANGRTYSFSIPGGGFVSLAHLVEALGIASGAEGDADLYAVADDLNDIPVSEATRQFVASIERVELSNPELVWIQKVENETTVGAVKDANALEIQYSPGLTEEQIAEINAQAIEADDWVLISLLPFATEETLTVTMKTGDQFVIKVTDHQEATSMAEFDGTTQFVIWTENAGHYYVLKNDGSTEEISLNEIDSLGREYLWTVTYGWEQEQNVDYRYFIKPVTNPQSSLTMNWIDQDLVQGGECGIRFYPNPSQSDAWYLEGWNWTRLYLDPSTQTFEVSMGQYSGSYSWMHFSKQDELPRFEFTVQAESTDQGAGRVSGVDKDGINQQAQESYTAVTADNKTNRNVIHGDPISLRYLFDYWDLNGETLYWDPVTQTISTEPGEGKTTDFGEIPAGKLTIPYNKSTLTAHFKRNPDYEVTDDEKEGRLIDMEELMAWIGDLMDRDFPLNDEGCKKTAELYDYENRIYRVDLTAQSNMSALAGTVDLGFMLDVSASMLFPSKLDMVANWNNTQTTDNKDSQLQLLLNNINDNNWNKANWLNRYTTYYIIADKTSTATVDKLWFDWNAYVWKWKDASKDDSKYATIDHNTKFHRSDAAGLTYPIYVDGDSPHTRSHYLEQSMTGTLLELESIMDKLNVAANPSQASKVLIAYNKFHKDVIDSHYAFVPVDEFNFGTYSYDGGTSTDRALDDAQHFAWASSAAKYAILITDGAPQRSGIDVSNDEVAAEALELKNQGVTLITVGLSMGDVKRGSVLLYDIASTDANGDPYFYSAETGDELPLVLLEIIRQIMADAITVGTVTDTINEAFYPVDKSTGVALAVGNVIDLNGIKIADSESALTQEQRDAGYGVIGTAANGNYTVTWPNQDFSWDGWHGTVYEKAKEDFLGGNAVRTNDPSNPATIVPIGYKVDSDDATIPFMQEIVTGQTQTMATPRVNVNELNLTENSTEWTVYLGAEVSVKEQLQKLFDNMHVEQVVTNASDTDGDGLPDTMAGTSLYYPLEESSSDQRDGVGTRHVFSLKDLLKKSHGGVDVTIDDLIAAGDEGITWTYDLYGQDNPGTITVKLTKVGSKAAYDTHVTTETGEPVEQYAISVLFSPDYAHIPAGQGGDGSLPYNTGYYGLGTYGNAAGTEEGLNEHLINVFAKKLQLQKVDQTHTAVTRDSATFGLYRAATVQELADGEVVKATLPGLDGSYVKVQTLTTQNGVVTTDPLKLLKSVEDYDEPYYLVEESAPAGFIKMTDVLKVSIDMTGHNTWTEYADASRTSQTKPDPYVLSNWQQEATIKVTDLDGNTSTSAIRVTPEGQHGITYDSVNDTTEASVTYQIINNSGAVLPSTGGPGTQIFSILGGMLVASAATAALLVRRRAM